MAGAGLVPPAIVLAFGAGALGGAEALRLLRQFAGRSAAVDLATCVLVISLLTSPVLGTMLLARFVRKAAGPADGAAPAPATDLFALVTATLSVGAALLVTACLLVVPGGAVHLPIDFAVENPIVVTVVAICAAFAFSATAAGGGGGGVGSLACTVHLRALRFFRVARSAGGPTPATPATTIKAVFVVTVSLVACFLASGGFDAHAQLLFRELHWRRSMVILPVAVAVATVAGTMLLVRCSRRARNTAGAGGGAAAAARPS